MNKKMYELPISKEYVHTWGIEEAIREIMQNAIDSETDGNPLQVTYEDGLLSIRNYGCKLDISSLVLGNTGKGDKKYIGTYGEGFKLALVVLLRNGLGVTISTNGERWEPEFKKSRKFKIDTLHIYVSKDDNVSEDVIQFEISGLDVDTFEEIRDRNLAMKRSLGYNEGLTVESEYGNILLDKQYKGMMFVNGLYVQTDSSFRYGYDFKPEYLHLDRDRKAINYYKLRELTSKAITSQMNIEIVTTAMSKNAVDVRDIIDNLDDITKEFKTNFANDFIKRHELDEDTFVGTEKEVTIAKKEKSYVVESKAVAALVNSGLDKEDEYKEIQQRVRELSKEETAEDYFEGSDWERVVNFFIEKRHKFNDEEIGEIKDIIEDCSSLHTLYFSYIVDKYLDEMVE
jgi:hypothetical protein